MERGVLKYGEYDGEQSEPIRVDRDRESQTRVKKRAEKAEKIRVSTVPYATESGKMEQGILKYGQYDGEQSQPI